MTGVDPQLFRQLKLWYIEDTVRPISIDYSSQYLFFIWFFVCCNFCYVVPPAMSLDTHPWSPFYFDEVIASFPSSLWLFLSVWYYIYSCIRYIRTSAELIPVSFPSPLPVVVWSLPPSSQLSSESLVVSPSSLVVLLSLVGPRRCRSSFLVAGLHCYQLPVVAHCRYPFLVVATLGESSYRAPRTLSFTRCDCAPFRCPTVTSPYSGHRYQ